MNDLLSLQDLFNKKIFRIPDYQRGYSWTNQQLEEFWSDVINLLPDKEHYTGMISLKKLSRDYTKSWNDEQWLFDKKGYEAYHIVDGQQRLTTFIILINEIVNYYKKAYSDKELDNIFINSTSLKEIIEEFLVIVKPDSENVVKTYKFGYEVDNPSYEYFKTKILESGNVGNDIETFYTLNLEKAKKFFIEQINELVKEQGISALENLFFKITQKMMFNMYYIDDDFNVFIAFETMDDIKFKVLEYCEKDKLNEREQYWINYFECFLYGFNQFNEIFETNKLIAEIYYKEQSKINYDEIAKKGKKLINNFENQLRNLKKEYLIYRYYSFNISLLLGSYIDLYNILNKMSQDHFDEMNYHFDDILDETCTNINFFIAYLGKMGYIKEPKDELKVLEINK